MIVGSGDENDGWFEARSISSSYSVIAQVTVVLKRTVVDHQQQFFSEQPSPGKSHYTEMHKNVHIPALTN